MAVDRVWEMKTQFTEEKREDRSKRRREHKGESASIPESRMLTAVRNGNQSLDQIRPDDVNPLIKRKRLETGALVVNRWNCRFLPSLEGIWKWKRTISKHPLLFWCP